MLPTTTPEPLAGCYGSPQRSSRPARSAASLRLLPAGRPAAGPGDRRCRGQGDARRAPDGARDRAPAAIGRGEAGPADILRELDARLSQGNDMCMFVTMACDLDEAASSAWRARATSGRSAARRRRHARARPRGRAGAPDSAPTPCPVWVGISPRRRLILCTDGVTEAFTRRARPSVSSGSGASWRTPGRHGRRLAATRGGRHRALLRGRRAARRHGRRGAQFQPAGITVDTQSDEAWRLSVASACRAGRRRAIRILRARDVPPR